MKSSEIKRTYTNDDIDRLYKSPTYLEFLQQEAIDFYKLPSDLFKDKVYFEILNDARQNILDLYGYSLKFNDISEWTRLILERFDKMYKLYKKNQKGFKDTEMKKKEMIKEGFLPAFATGKKTKKEGFTDSIVPEESPYVYSIGSNTELQEKLISGKSVKEAKRKGYLLDQVSITVDSRYRDYLRDETPFNFTTNLSIGRPTTAFLTPYDGTIYNLEKIENIVSIKLIRTTFPNYISETDSIVDNKYFYIKINEIRGESYGYPIISAKTFATLFSDRRKDINLTSREMYSRPSEIKFPIIRPLSKLPTLSLKIYDHAGNIFNPGTDRLKFNDTLAITDITRIDYNNYRVIFTSSTAHGLFTGDRVYFRGVRTVIGYSLPATPFNIIPIPDQIVSNEVINREEGYIISKLNETQIQVDFTLEDTDFYIDPSLFPIFLTINWKVAAMTNIYIFKANLQTDFTFNIEFLRGS